VYITDKFKRFITAELGRALAFVKVTSRVSGTPNFLGPATQKRLASNIMKVLLNYRYSYCPPHLISAAALLYKMKYLLYSPIAQQ